MNFQRGKQREEPEINLIALIDVLLVILIFLMITTSYTKMSELQINLPQAQADKSVEKPSVINVSVDASSHFVVNSTPVVFSGVEAFSVELRRAAGDKVEPTVVINADANTPHQSVINIMEASRLAGFSRVTFATQAGPAK